MYSSENEEYSSIIQMLELRKRLIVNCITSRFLWIILQEEYNKMSQYWPKFYERIYWYNNKLIIIEQKIIFSLGIQDSIKKLPDLILTFVSLYQCLVLYWMSYLNMLFERAFMQIGLVAVVNKTSELDHLDLYLITFKLSLKKSVQILPLKL